MREAVRIRKREEMKTEDCWAIEDLYANDEEWAADAQRLEKKVEEFSRYKGRLGENSQVLFQMLEAYSEINEFFERIYIYANQKLHEDTGSSKYQQLSGEAQVLMTGLNSQTAYVVPEILEIPEEVLNRFLEEDDRLSVYKMFLHTIIRRKEHTLSVRQEEFLAHVEELAKGPGNIFGMFNNADITFPSIHDEQGNQVPLTQGRYVTYLESNNRRVRKEAFTSLYQSYGQFKNTLAATFDANVRQAAFFTKERNYGSSLEAALDKSNIPVAVYDNLIKTVHEKLPSMYRYMDIRKKALGVDELHMYDVYVPLVSDIKMEIPFERAKEIVLEGLAPLGEEYRERLKEGFSSRWIDVYENEGKRTGAYSWGAYGTHPYVLLNYQNTLNHVFTLAHEMGHALHSYYSDEHQPYLYAGYKIFVAEVASTCNEALLIHHLMKVSKNQKERAYLMNYFLNQFKGTLYRQTMFAEFEKISHDVVEKGGTLHAELLNETYFNLNKTYFGEGTVIDPEIALEWGRIPHFYTPFYVYQYATGFSAAIAISRKIINGEEGIVEKYKTFLSGGSSMDCIDLLKICGVDMTQPKPIQEALEVFDEYLTEFEHII